MRHIRPNTIVQRPSSLSHYISSKFNYLFNLKIVINHNICIQKKHLVVAIPMIVRSETIGSAHYTFT